MRKPKPGLRVELEKLPKPGGFIWAWDLIEYNQISAKSLTFFSTKKGCAENAIGFAENTEPIKLNVYYNRELIHKGSTNNAIH